MPRARSPALRQHQGNHGPVRVANTYHFAYADGTPYKQIGTTCYVWTHQGDELEEQTLATLGNAPFNKMRMCVFPKHYAFNENEPERYPFPCLSRGSAHGPAAGQSMCSPAGRSISAASTQTSSATSSSALAQLRDLGIEADIILFHPYDRWGFATMDAETDDRYLRYVVARLAAYRNVWWSMANEFDFMPAQANGRLGSLLPDRAGERPLWAPALDPQLPWVLMITQAVGHASEYSALRFGAGANLARAVQEAGRRG